MRKNPKTRRIIDFLEINSDIDSNDVLTIAEKVPCSEGLVWRVLREFRENEKIFLEEYSFINELIIKLRFIGDLFLSFYKNRDLKTVERKRLIKIMKSVDRYEEYLDIESYKSQRHFRMEVE